MSKAVPNPAGFQRPPSNPVEHAVSRASNQNGSTDPHSSLKMKKAWEAAWSPAKSIPMNAFMLWMAGSGIQIFSIMITVMLLYQPIKAIFGVKTVFEPFRSTGTSKQDTLLMPMLLFIALQACVFGLGLWKCSSMGLLPTAKSDWLAFIEPKLLSELAVGGILVI